MAKYKNWSRPDIVVDAWCVTKNNAATVAGIVNSKFSKYYQAEYEDFPEIWEGKAVLQVADLRWKDWCEQHGIWPSDFVPDGYWVIFNLTANGRVAFTQMTDAVFKYSFHKDQSK